MTTRLGSVFNEVFHLESLLYDFPSSYVDKILLSQDLWRNLTASLNLDST